MFARPLFVGNDFVRDAIERNDPVHTAHLDGDLGHAEDYAGRFGLCDGLSADIMHFPHATGAIVTHAGHDYTQRITSGNLGHRAKQYIDRGFVTVDHRTIGYRDRRGPAAPCTRGGRGVSAWCDPEEGRRRLRRHYHERDT